MTDIKILIEAVHAAIQGRKANLGDVEGQAREVFARLVSAEQAQGVSRGQPAAVITAEGDLVLWCRP
jgi:hypothetical protein